VWEFERRAESVRVGYPSKSHQYDDRRRAKGKHHTQAVLALARQPRQAVAVAEAVIADPYPDEHDS
jgi:hypothetical protein